MTSLCNVVEAEGFFANLNAVNCLLGQATGYVDCYAKIEISVPDKTGKVSLNQIAGPVYEQAERRSKMDDLTWSERVCGIDLSRKLLKLYREYPWDGNQGLSPSRKPEDGCTFSMLRGMHDSALFKIRYLFQGISRERYEQEIGDPDTIDSATGLPSHCCGTYCFPERLVLTGAYIRKRAGQK